MPPLCEVCERPFELGDLEDGVTISADCCGRTGMCAVCRRPGNHCCDLDDPPKPDEAEEGAMSQAWAEVERLMKANAKHRRGFRLQEMSGADILAHVQDEMAELLDSPHDIHELADVFGALIHYALRQGWSAAQVEAAILEKLRQRFHQERKSS